HPIGGLPRGRGQAGRAADRGVPIRAGGARRRPGDEGRPVGRRRHARRGDGALRLRAPRGVEGPGGVRRGARERPGAGHLRPAERPGAFSAIVLLVAVGMALGARSSWSRMGAWLSAIVATLALALSLSRGGWMGTGLGLVLMMVALP